MNIFKYYNYIELREGRERVKLKNDTDKGTRVVLKIKIKKKIEKTKQKAC